MSVRASGAGSQGPERAGDPDEVLVVAIGSELDRLPISRDHDVADEWCDDCGSHELPWLPRASEIVQVGAHGLSVTVSESRMQVFWHRPDVHVDAGMQADATKQGCWPLRRPFEPFDADPISGIRKRLDPFAATERTGPRRIDAPSSATMR